MKISICSIGHHFSTSSIVLLRILVTACFEKKTWLSVLSAYCRILRGKAEQFEITTVELLIHSILFLVAAIL